jgi:CheY-like chemotaxis protein
MRDRILDSLLGSPESEEIAYGTLMPRRVNNLLLVTSLYDCYTFIEDGRLSEMLVSEYLELNLRTVPSIDRVSTAEEALDRIRNETYHLVISMPRVGEMNVRDFGRAVNEISPELPVVLLASNSRELSQLQQLEGLPGIDRAFVWLGDVGLFLAIIKYIEDKHNAWHDARMAGVKSLLLVEDSVQFYSSYLPMLYTEVVKQTQALMDEGRNRMQKMMRMKARPKILLATTYEEAEEIFDHYKEDLLGVISDASFPRGGKLDRSAGRDFVQKVRSQFPQLPAVIQSGSDNASVAASAGVEFINKNSPHLLGDLRAFMENYLGFGDLVLRRPDGMIVARSSDIRSLEWALQAVPEESLRYHRNREDIYLWLRARTEFALAEAVRQITLEPAQQIEDERQALLTILATHRERSRAGIVSEFSSANFEGTSGFVRIGTGSLGGKGRGLAFMNSLLTTYKIEDRFPGIRIFVPPTAVLATNVFDRFMASSGLLPFALRETDDDAITRAFLKADLPEDVVEALWNFLDWVRYPLAVRSSSLLEDASYQPFAGIYDTFMIPNNSEDPERRLDQLCTAIKMVYASVYHADAKAYIDSTPNRLEEEKMAVVIQQIVGRKHGSRLYPNFAGVARSLNFYPMPGMKPEEGVASVALGMGKTVVDGGRCVRFCPAHPRKPMQSFSTDEYLENAQRSFYALEMPQATGGAPVGEVPILDLLSLDLEDARSDGTLSPVASVYSPDNDAIYDGLSRPGIPLVTLSGVLKGRAFPLCDILNFLLKMGASAHSCPVEMEFAVNLSEDAAKPHDFGFLQIRPLVLGTDAQDVQIEEIETERALCVAHKALGNGFIEGIRDVIYVCMDHFERADTPKIAWEIGALNAKLREAKRPFILVGPGRWGSSDPWLGIPVKWAQISGVRCIVETDMEDIHVDPSQGTHFFQNIMSFGIGYLTVDTKNTRDLLDFAWMGAQPAVEETPHLRHLSFESPLEVALNGRRNFGMIMKPGLGLKG